MEESSEKIDIYED